MFALIHGHLVVYSEHMLISVEYNTLVSVIEKIIHGD